MTVFTNRTIVTTLSFVFFFALCAPSLAQSGGGIYRGGVNPYNTKPTVSPYLNLLQNNQNLPQYQTLVRPFLEQQSINDFNQRESQLMRRQINTLQGRSAGAGTGVGPMRSTGHPTRFMNYSHYYNMR
jgi:hypothetical protein